MDRQHMGHGRNDYILAVIWNTLRFRVSVWVGLELRLDGGG